MQATEQAQQLFDPTRWPRRPHCTDSLEAGLQIRGFAQAKTKAYIQANPPFHRFWLLFDVDRPGAALAWEAANLPQPTWIATNPENAHAHLAYGLAAPVLWGCENARQKPIALFCAVEAAYRAALEADPAYTAKITKNPAHPRWRVWTGPRLDYDLHELADWVDLPKHAPRKKPEEVGFGRNVTLFHWLRQWAYRNVRKYKEQGQGLAAWKSACNCRALERNGEFQHPLDPSEVWQIAKSVSKWTWNRFDISAADARFSATQAARGRLSGKARAAASEDKRSSARLMAAQGMSQRAIAAELGVPRTTVQNWLNGGGR